METSGRTIQIEDATSKGTLNRISLDCQELSVNPLKQKTKIKKLLVDIAANKIGPITAQPTNYACAQRIRANRGCIEIHAGRPHLLQIGVISRTLIMWLQINLLNIGFAMYNSHHCM